MNIVKRTNRFFPSTSFFDDFLMRDLSDWPNFRPLENATLPSVNIVESNDEFMVEMAAPGMKKDDFKVELDNDTLIIYSERDNEEEVKDLNFTRREFSYSAFRRSFYLPNTVQADKIKAKYENGLLRLVIPKKEEAKRKPVKVINIS